MMLHDGKYEIFIVQKRNENDEWENVDVDETCFKNTGVKGTTDIDKARKLFCELMKGRALNDPRNYRVCKLDIWQDTTLIW
jgi:hypothetical protein